MQRARDAMNAEEWRMLSSKTALDFSSIFDRNGIVEEEGKKHTTIIISSSTKVHCRIEDIDVQKA